MGVKGFLMMPMAPGDLVSILRKVPDESKVSTFNYVILSRNINSLVLFRIPSVSLKMAGFMIICK